MRGRRGFTALAVLILVVGMVLFVPATVQAPAAGGPAGSVETVVLADPADPYYRLAEEIAAAQGLALVRDWDAAVALDPLNILWVAAPDRLNDPLMARAGLALNSRPALAVVGILTGSSLDAARDLWQRGQQVPPLTVEDDLFVANGEHATTGNIEPILTTLRRGAYTPIPLTLSSLNGALTQARYLTFSGHGSDGYLRLSDDERLTVQVLPERLPALVIGTASCQTLRPWEENSIALGFTTRGAAAYAGFVYSPNSGYLPGDYHGLPFRYTWPGFPIGRVVALQSRASLQSYAGFPFYHLLGDPRIALNAQPPYSLLGEADQGGARVLTFSAVEAGMVPVRVPGGAAYRFVEIPGVGAAANGDTFFNARVQVMDAQGDKYILFDHPGGPFSVRLRRSAPWHWAVTRPLLDSFDHVVLFTGQNGGGEIAIFFGLVALTAGLLRARRRPNFAARRHRLALTLLGIAALIGLAFTLYALLRLPQAAITTKPLTLLPAWMIGAGLLAGAGGLLWVTARGWPGRAIALLVSALPALLPGLFMAAAMTFINWAAVQQVGASIYGYRSALICLPAAVVIMAVMGGLYRGLLNLPHPAQ